MRTFEQCNIEYNQECAAWGDFEYRVTLERAKHLKKIESLRDEAAAIQKNIPTPITSPSGQVAEKLANADDAGVTTAEQAVS